MNSEEIKLTQTVSCGGCASKLNPLDLYSVLNKLPTPHFQNLLVDFETGDDACIYKLNEETALVFTTDFIAPLIDSPFDFGRVAATNALSDIYAMGGTPLMALNIVCFDEELGNSVLEQILLGASEACSRANTIICGGHTVTAPEVRFGLAVIGTVNPKKITTNSNGKPGDNLILTKPLGTGILSQAMKYGLLDDELTAILVNQLCTLNDKVAKAIQSTNVNCATDITGFGLAGHLHKLAKSSNCGATLFMDKIPILPKALEYASDNIHSGILKRNRTYVQDYLNDINETNPKIKILFDPQTSGGFLIAVNESELETLTKALKQEKVEYYLIGHLTREKAGSLKIL